MILTGRDLRGARPGPAAEPRPEPREAPAARPEGRAPGGRRVRMFHPDDPGAGMTCSSVVLGREFKVERGVATVEADMAAELERLGWLRGAEVD